MRRATSRAVFVGAVLLVVAGSALAAPTLRVETDRSMYVQGEDALVSLVNDFRDPVASGAGFHVTTQQGVIVWMTAWDPSPVIVPPEGSLDYVWDLTYRTSSLGDDFVQVARGTYVIHANDGRGKKLIRIEEPTVVPFETVDEGAMSSYRFPYRGEVATSDSAYLVIKNEASWTSFWSTHTRGITPAPDRPFVDFSTEMIIVALHGVYPGDGADVTIDGISDHGTYRNVSVTLHNTYGTVLTATNPYRIVKTSHTDLPVEFTETVIDERMAVPFETIDEGGWTSYGDEFMTDSSYFVIRDDAAWTDFWIAHKAGTNPPPETPSVDFSSDMIIVAIHGWYPVIGAEILVHGIFDHGTHWGVNVISHKWDGVFQLAVNPYEIVRVPYSDLPVEFSETVVDDRRH